MGATQCVILFSQWRHRTEIGGESWHHQCSSHFNLTIECVQHLNKLTTEVISLICKAMIRSSAIKTQNLLQVNFQTRYDGLSLNSLLNN